MSFSLTPNIDGRSSLPGRAFRRVAWDDYRRRVAVLATRWPAVVAADLDRAFDGAVMDAGVLDRLGTALQAGRPIVLSGAAGSGKTFVAERLVQALTGDALLPVAVDLDGRRVAVFDPGLHVAIGDALHADWVRVRRPLIKLHAALAPAADDLDGWAGLAFAACQGVLVIDGVGEDACRDRPLVSRLLEAADSGVVHLARADGSRVTVPFASRLIFTCRSDAAALDALGLDRARVARLVLEALPEGAYRELVEVLADARGVTAGPAAIEQLVSLHRASRLPFVPGIAAQVMQALADRSRYIEPVAPPVTAATPALVDWAWQERVGPLPGRAHAARRPRLAYSRNRANPSTGSRSVTKPFSGRDGSA